MGDNDKSRRIRDMFGAIAGRYDFLNHFLSLNIDSRWRKICVGEVEKRLAGPIPKILDIGCGTADLSLAFSRLGPVIGCDFCHPMLCIGAHKVEKSKSSGRIHLVEGDALTLPFADASFDAAVSAFVLRNLADMDRGLMEVRRVLRPGGVMGILEFGLPRMPLLASLYRMYFFQILPKFGKLISGVEGPYGYLPASVQSFPPAEKLKEKAEKAGFQDVDYRLLTGGVAVLILGVVGRD